MRILSVLSVVLIPSLLSGCVASKIVTAPFRAAGTVVETAVDATTQTQSEREEDLGRKVLAERKRQRDFCSRKHKTSKSAAIAKMFTNRTIKSLFPGQQGWRKFAINRLNRSHFRDFLFE